MHGRFLTFRIQSYARSHTHTVKNVFANKLPRGHFNVYIHVCVCAYSSMLGSRRGRRYRVYVYTIWRRRDGVDTYIIPPPYSRR